MKFERATVGLLLGAVLAIAMTATADQPATAAATAIPQLESVTNLPAEWTCLDLGDCLDFSGYVRGTNRSADPNAWGTQQCRSGHNCVHYVAWRTVTEWVARDATPAGWAAANACQLGGNPSQWDSAARACGWAVDQTVPQAGDILQYDGRQRLNGYGATTSTGHVDFIDAVEPLPNGDSLLYLSFSGCSGTDYRLTATLSEVVADGIDIIHVPYTRDKEAFVATATTGDMAQWLYRLAGSPDVDLSFDPFATLGPDDPRFRAASWLHTNGIVVAQDFNPNTILDRQLMASYLYAYDGLDGTRAQSTGAFAGATYDPTDPVSTSELAQVLYTFAGAPAVEVPQTPPWYDVDGTEDWYRAALWSWETTVSRDRFVDVPMNHELYPAITKADSAGLLSTYAGDLFGADEAVSRQEVAGFLYRLAGKPMGTSPVDALYTDVASDHPFITEISWMVGQGLATGYPDGTFRPEDTVTRQVLAAYLYRAAGSPSYAPPLAATFPDVAVGDLYRKEIEWAYSVGALTGRDNGEFGPDEPAQRGTLVGLVERYATVQ
jgi:surface antigen